MVYRELRLIPDWPRVRKLVAKRMKLSEEDVQRMQDSGNSLERVELLVSVEEVLDSLKK